MHGKILGYGGDSGVILTEAGERFPFLHAAWKEDEPPQRGQLVDFIVTDGRAHDIYRALDSAKAAPRTPTPIPMPTTAKQILSDSASLSSNISKTLQTVSERDDQLGQVVARVRAMPQILLAAIMLFAAFAMSFLSIGYQHKDLQQLGFAALPSAVSLTGLSEETGTIREALELQHDAIDKLRDQLDTQAQSEFGRSAPQIEMRQKIDKMVKTMSKLERLLGLSWIAWLVPVLCVAVIGFGWAQYAAAKPVGMVLGALSIAVAAYPYILVRFTTDLINASGNPAVDANALLIARRAAQKVASLESGGWVIALCGIGCIIAALIRTPPPVEEEW